MPQNSAKHLSQGLVCPTPDFRREIIIIINKSEQKYLRALRFTSFQVHEHGGRILEVAFPPVAEPGHRGAVDDPVVRGPRHVHNMSADDVAFVVETR